MLMCLKCVLRITRAQAPMMAVGFRVEVAKWLALVRLLMGEVPEHSEFTAPGLAKPLAAYFGIAQAVRAGDLTTFRYVAMAYVRPAPSLALLHAAAGGREHSMTVCRVLAHVAYHCMRLLWSVSIQAAAQYPISTSVQLQGIIMDE